MKRLKKGDGKWIGCSGYTYKGYEIYSMYHSPDRRVVWEAVNIETGAADVHAFRKRDIKFLIDEQENKSSSTDE